MRQFLIGVDQLLNTLFGGYADETISARCWRLQHRKPYSYLRPAIDGLFFWQDEHCRKSYDAEIKRKHSPRSQRPA
jgi:hypothetical protein